MSASVPSSQMSPVRFASLAAVFLAALGLALALLGGTNPLVGTASGNIGTSAESYGGLSFRLQGCDRSVTTTLPNGSGKFICPNGLYTDGNLGQNWNELDLVPHRVLINAGNNPDTTYHFQVEADYKVFGSPDKIGYDFISAQPESVSGGCNVSFGPSLTRGAGTNNDPIIIYRDVTVTNQQPNTTCQIDYYMRLALGSHLWPGASLHSRLANNIGTSKNIGNKENSIPVNQISPQELAKDMTATQGTDHAWDITKEPTPATVGFDNTCDPSSANGAPVSIKVTWEKFAATPNGPITVVTHVYATNPAARVITTSVMDNIRSGTTVLDTANSGSINVPANTANFEILTHTTTVPAGTTNLNDVATATYTDQATGIPIPGSTTATASAPVQFSGPEANASATITDSESITGPGFTFSADSFTPDVGGFDPPYLAGTHTVGPVGWTSDTQNDSGSVTFSKTIYAASGSTSSGELSDTATVTGSDGFTKSTSASVDVSASAKVSLVIKKNIPNVLQGSETESFTFNVKNSNGVTVATKTLSFAAGDTTKSVTVDNLAPDEYTVSEQAAAGWSSQADKTVDLSDPTAACSRTAEFSNSISASAEALKVTDPVGNESGWHMVLNGPGTPPGGEDVATDANGKASFATALQEGHYTITEVQQSGWDKTSATGDCDFDVNFPADGGETFTCTITNVKQGSIKVIKDLDPATDSGRFDLKVGSDVVADEVGDGGNGTKTGLSPNTYTVSEEAGSTSPTQLSDYVRTIECSGEGAAQAGHSLSVHLAAGENAVCTITNHRKPKLTVIKHVINDNGGQADASAWSIHVKSDGSEVAGSPKDGSEAGDTYDLAPGTYKVSETGGPTGYGFDGFSGACNSSGYVTLAYGDNVTCTLTNNDQPGTIVIIKNATPQNGVFTFTTGGSTSGPGTSWPTSPTNNFTLTGSTVNDGNQKSFKVDAGDYTVKEDLQLSWLLTGIGGAGPSAPYDCSVTGSNGSTGSGVLSTREVSISINIGDTVTCVFENTGNGATRTQGFWATHSQLAKIAWFGGSGFGHAFPGVANTPGIGNATLCGRPIDTLGKLMGGFWSDISKTSTGKKRSALDQARMQLLQQLLAAELNASAFGSVPSGGTAKFGQWESAYCGTNQTALQTAQQQSASFNSQGDSSTFTPGTSADSKTGRAIADKAFWNVLP
jgi:hypothetical protein